MENISCPVVLDISPELEYYIEVSITSLICLGILNKKK